MSSFWLGMLVGGTLGTWLGMILMSLFVLAKRADKQSNLMERRIKEDINSLNT